jgi:hypothetical protein
MTEVVVISYDYDLQKYKNCYDSIGYVALS